MVLWKIYSLSTYVTKIITNGGYGAIGLYNELLQTP